jgi:TRAP-type C4-dicarboxylate transport system substrate-binding protein
MMTKLNNVSRRDFMRVAGRYGLMSTLLGATGLSGMVTLPRLAEAANSTYDKRFKNKAKVNLKYGATGLDARRLLIMRAGFLNFVNDLEERTDGAIRVEFIGNNQICGDLNCVRKAQQGIVDIYSSSTQNAAGAAPYFNVLDYAYMFPSRASIYYFLYHPKSEALLREPLRQRHNVQFLFSHGELRGIMLGNKWRDKPTVKSVTQLAGTKNRVTGTQLGRIAMNLMDLNPVPIAWEETLDGLKQGLIDGAETWMSAVAQVGMAPIVSQAVDLQFFCGTEHTAISTGAFNKLGSDLQDQMMESAYFTQAFVQASHEASLVNTVGASNPQKPDTIFAKAGTRVAELSPAELKKAEEMCSPESQPKQWEEWRERLNTWSGGHDTYKEIYVIAREIPSDMPAEAVEPRRWWKA